MKKIIKLIPASTADDLSCPDGEVLNSDLIFGKDETVNPDDTKDPDNPDDPGDPDSPESPTPSGLPTVISENPLNLPADAEFLALHRPVSGLSPIAIIRTSDGHLAYNSGTLPGISPLSTVDETFWSHLTPDVFPARPRVAAVEEWLVILTDTSLLYARWNGRAYDWHGERPAPPALVFSTVDKALPPYSTTDGELPRFSLAVPVGTDSNGAIQQKKKEFLQAVEEAGLLFEPVKAKACWQMKDGSYWLPTAEKTIGQSEPVKLTTVSSEYRDGLTNLTVEISRSPYEVRVNTLSAAPPWNSVIEKAKAFVSESGDNFPEINGAPDSAGLPSKLFSIGGRLYTLHEGDRKLAYTAMAKPYMTSQAGQQTACGKPIIYLTAMMRTTGNRNENLRTLHAFTAEGIHELTPGGDGKYSDARLLSRHVSAGENAFAPLPDGTAAITRSGVVKVSGSSVSVILPGSVHDFSAEDRLAYLYREDQLLLYRAGIFVRIIDSKTLGRARGIINAHHYAWPEIWISHGRLLGRARINEGEEPSSGNAAPDISGGTTAGTPDSPDISKPVEILPVKTRPIKLTDAFSIKKVEEIKAIWPDGTLHSLRLYGALQPGKWYFVGHTRGGRMLTRGSGWRFFKIETFANSGVEGCRLPQIFIKFASE